MAAIRTLRLVAVTLVAVLATGVAACGGSDELTIYSGRIEALIGPAIKLYEKDSGEKVKTRYGDSPSLAATLVEEGKNSRADLFYAQDAGSLDAIEKAGNLERLPADLLNQVPARFRSRDGRWVGVTARSRDHRLRPGTGQDLRAARLAARADRGEVEGPRGLGADERVAAGLHHGAAARRGRGRRAQVAEGHGRQRRAGLRLQRADPRRDRQGRTRPRPDQPLLRRRGAGEGSEVPRQGPLPDEGPRLARQRLGCRRSRVKQAQGGRRSTSSGRC